MKRRTFLLSSAVVAAGAALPITWAALRDEEVEVPIDPADSRSAAVLWYSQTGNTARYGRLIAHVLRGRGLDVVAGDYRTLGPAAVTGRDLVIAGTPVQYFDVPANLRDFLTSLPPIAPARIAAYCTFGGPGGNVTNTAIRLLEALADRGGVPVAFERFGNLSTFAPTWSLGNEARILAYRHLPDASTYDRVRAFATRVLDRARAGTGIETAKRPDPSDLFRGGLTRVPTKWMMGGHRIEASECVGCLACQEACPVGAIAVADGRIDSGACLACMGCVNHCPTGALRMTFLGRDVEGWRRFSERVGIAIEEPSELVPPGGGPA